MTGFVDQPVSITEESREEERGVEPDTHARVGAMRAHRFRDRPGPRPYFLPRCTVVGEGIEPPYAELFRLPLYQVSLPTRMFCQR